jgi:hypothetical protein
MYIASCMCGIPCEHLATGAAIRDDPTKCGMQLRAFRRGGLDPNPYAVESRKRRGHNQSGAGAQGGFVKIQRRMVFLDPAHSVIAALQGA